MKLIHHLIFIFWFTNLSNSQKFPQEQFPFPPQFKSPNAPNGVFGSDKSIYLPPESHTTMPMYSINNGNKLPFNFLPPTATKVPSMYPTPFPMIMSSSMAPRRDEEDTENEQEQKPPIQHYQTPIFRNKNGNKSDSNHEHNTEREMRPMPKNFNYQHPIDRIDIKFAPQMHTVTQKTPVNQSPASQRRMIISSEILKNEQGLDQIRRASLLPSQLNSSPSIAYYSTTEPAIPILRLSNEMDLDGSFSYEALGADQTHYVQHSRMENSGTDKEEQVVEGSYSYVGDNGQTYTVHYVADSNGYRATGEHLPVPPPIPEIIQRAIQYNLAEEARRPPQQKSWQDDEKQYDHSENEKHRFSILPTRNLFTGRTPEAFSFGSTQSPILQNKIGTEDNSQAATKSNFDFSGDQSNKGKIINGPIAPQITFLASQGAHNPSLNTGHQQPSRIFSNEKPNLPQLMNYEAGSSESDQDNNKALWRWQYGLNTNGAVNNQHPNKNSISRSFGEGDDVIINFNNMSPEQYTKILNGGFSEHSTEFSINEDEFKNNEPRNIESSTFFNLPTSGYIHITTTEANKQINDQDNHKNFHNTSFSENHLSSTESIMPYTDSSDWSKHMKDVQYNDKFTYLNKNNYVSDPSISQQSYGYSEGPSEYINSKAENYYVTTVSPVNNINDNYSRKTEEKATIKNLRSDPKKEVTTYSSVDDILNHKSNIKFTDFIQAEEKNNFKPIVNIKYEREAAHETTTTETSPDTLIKENYFLKSLFKTDHENMNKQVKVTEEPERQYNNIINLEPKFEKVPKFIQYQSKSQNEVKNLVKKPIDITDVLNYITLKNHFESNKLKSNNKLSNSVALNKRYERQTFIPLENNRNEEEEQLDQEESQNNLRVLNNQKQQELRGIIKNYKVLQRNGNTKAIGLNKDQVMTDSSRLKTFQTQSLPPLGRAGPSMKSYLPPTYL